MAACVSTPPVPASARASSASLRMSGRVSASSRALEMEKQTIAEALQRANGNKSRAAAALGLTRQQLPRRLRRFGLTA